MDIKKLFGNKPQQDPSAMADTYALANVRSKLMDEREFWDSVIQYMVEEGSRLEDVERAVNAADLLLEKRRERFPL